VSEGRLGVDDIDGDGRLDVMRGFATSFLFSDRTKRPKLLVVWRVVGLLGDH